MSIRTFYNAAETQEIVATLHKAYSSDPKAEVEFSGSLYWWHTYTCPHSDKQDKTQHDDCVAGKCGMRQDFYIITHKGHVLKRWERNGYDDSDFNALVFIPEKDEFKTIEYASTRYWTYNNGCSVDATDEVVFYAVKSVMNTGKLWLAAINERESKTVDVGKKITVHGGRKHRGKNGIVTWVGPSKFDKYAITARVKDDSNGEFFYIDTEHLTVLNPEQYIWDQQEMMKRVRQHAAAHLREWGKDPKQFLSKYPKLYQYDIAEFIWMVLDHAGIKATLNLTNVNLDDNSGYVFVCEDTILAHKKVGSSAYLSSLDEQEIKQFIIKYFKAA